MRVGERRKGQASLRNLQSVVGARRTRRDESRCRYVQEQLTRGARRVQAYRIAPLASVLVEKQRIQLVDMHKDGCPWKKWQYDGRLCRTLSLHICCADPFLADVYRIPLSSPAAMAKEIKSRARSLESILEGVEIKHPLVRAIRTARCSIISSLVYSRRLKFKPLCRLSRLSKRSRSSKRK